MSSESLCEKSRRIMTTGDSHVEFLRRRPIVLPSFVYFLLTLSTAAAAGTCSFPDYLQSRDGIRRWMSHVTYGGNSRCPTTTWRDVYFVGDLWETRMTTIDCSKSNSTTMLYRRRCVTSVSRHHRYIVRHDVITVLSNTTIPIENTSPYDVARQRFGSYACVEFVRRSKTVVQLRESSTTWTTSSFLETACSGTGDPLALKLDDWLLVDYGAAFFLSSEPCRFAGGGFSTRVFDKLARRGICDAFDDETRVESRCSVDEEDRIHFRFRYLGCVPEALGMDVNQPAYCLANWNDDDGGKLAYTVLRHHRSRRTWCLRYPAVTISHQSSSSEPRHSFTAYLFRDPFCERTPTRLATVRYLMIDFIPSLSYVEGVGNEQSPTAAATAKSLVDGRLLCRDEYEACEFWRQPCRHAGSAKMLSCSRRCGICNDARPAVCQLPQHLRGRWNQKFTAIHQRRDAPTTDEIIITQHFVQINAASVRLQCVTWDSLEFIVVNNQTSTASPVERMFVRTYDNGCRPRYECIQFHLVASGILLYRRSRYRLWPFNGTTGITVDCRSLFTYHDDDGYQLLVSTSGVHSSCRFPANVVDVEWNVEFKSGLSCRGSVSFGKPLEAKTAEETQRNMFKLLLQNCPAGHDSEQIYQCLDSSIHYDGEANHRELAGDAVLASADSAGGNILCWWFPRSDRIRFILLPAPACYDLKLMASLRPLAVFTRSSVSTNHATTLSTPGARSQVSDDLSQQRTEPVTDVVNGSSILSPLRNLLMLLCVVSIASIQ